jgi:hypothetical protein
MLGFVHSARRLRLDAPYAIAAQPTLGSEKTKITTGNTGDTGKTFFQADTEQYSGYRCRRIPSGFFGKKRINLGERGNTQVRF